MNNVGLTSQKREEEDKKGRALDNIYIERVWRTVKRDYVYLKPSDDGWQLEKGLKEFFSHYNYDKHYQGVERKKPCELYHKLRCIPFPR